MLDLNKKWNKIDNNFESFENDEIKIIKPINDEKIPIDCPKCSNLFSGLEDVQAFKRNGVCENCELIYWVELHNK